mmetsp:Transcript_18637/g.24001  ORF Transcript_18637/g.24001 Transcript_18637/m.24001 type:complete len:121 (+) Transcript_18637:151-513(+)|eukprot:CAMPEP_0198136514 /NCGR_PEP_ID=MMETSP1443-20131203/159_1 /TAXON_ID=186043 /ORGANISM="Entomoneis sp., Strain CCMP2396" /LENGTH=120 /DNA_ID=CAMNT_0043797745 /DNA_START=105 /DNA_END=467 /DNA_ORIENTATION=+
MNALKKEQKDEFATVFAMLCLYDGGADITSDQINNLLQATGNTEVEGFYPVIFSGYAGNPEKLAQLIAVPSSGGGGGGGGAAGGGAGAEAEAAVVEEEPEEEEAPPAVDVFGGGGGGGDY